LTIFLEKKLLLLDLDETLIHSETMRKGKSTGNYDFIFTIKADETYNYDEVNIPQKSHFPLTFS
jgi:TFIIF-interacting CTD phosphatase-like protein